MAKIELTPKQHEHLNWLADSARSKRQIARDAYVRRKEGKDEWDRWYKMVRGEAEEASEAHRKAYRDLGIPNKQTEYQRECISKGLCRECHKKAENGTYCEACKKLARERSKNRRRKGKK